MKKIAVISTVWFPFSHTDVIVQRWLRPYPTDAANGWCPEGTVIASITIEQTPENEIGKAICAKEGLPIFPTIREALTLGGDTLAVDAVLIIGEHGDYPENEYSQKLYPRKRLFDDVAAVFREMGRSLPVFNDKHLSWSFRESEAMIRTAEELGFPIYAGSSIPHCPIVPELPVKEGEQVKEALAIYFGHLEHYGYHSIEFALAVMEARKGGETGIRAVRSLSGQSSLEALEAEGVSPELLRTVLLEAGYPDFEGMPEFVLRRSEEFTLYQFEHLDGTRVSHLHLHRTIHQWLVGVRTTEGILRACHSVAGTAGDFYSNFAQLCTRIQTFFLTGKAPSHPLRTHLTAGALERALHALKDQPGEWIATPELLFSYPAMPPTDVQNR